VAVSGWSATLEGIRTVDTPRRSSIVVDLQLRSGGHDAGVYRPMLSTYPGSSQAIGTPSVRTTPTTDAYLTLTEVDPTAGTATVRLAVNPLVLELWLSVVVMVAGAVVAGWPRRRRAARPKARPEPEPAAEPAGVVEPVP
jgi:cytochrome c-type biogenesis protein CcmF